MAGRDQDPTLQEVSPKGRQSADSPMELTTGDFVAVEPIRPAGRSRRGNLPALLAWLVVLVLLAGAAFFALRIWLPGLEATAALRRQVERQKRENVMLAEQTRSQGAALDEALQELNRMRGELTAIQAELQRLQPDSARDEPEQPAPSRAARKGRR